MESTATVASATAANAPAKMKINARKIILLSPAPLQKISSLWLKLSFLFINKEKILAMRMATMTGILNRSEEHTSELQSRGHLVCRLLLERKKIKHITIGNQRRGSNLYR